VIVVGKGGLSKNVVDKGCHGGAVFLLNTSS